MRRVVIVGWVGAVVLLTGIVVHRLTSEGGTSGGRQASVEVGEAARAVKTGRSGPRAVGRAAPRLANQPMDLALGDPNGKSDARRFAERSQLRSNARYHFSNQGVGTFVATHPLHDTALTFHRSGSVVTTRSGHSPVSLRPVALGRNAAALASAPALEETAPSLGQCPDLDRVDPEGECIARVERRMGTLTEWWANQSRGLEHGFTVHRARQGDGNLRLRMRVDGAEIEVSASDRLRLARLDGPALLYDALTAKDAAGRALEAHFEAAEGGFDIVVDDEGAHYPLAIDPYVYPDAAFTFSNAEYGVRPVGDVNGDGYADFLKLHLRQDGAATYYSFQVRLGAADGVGSWATSFETGVKVTDAVGVGDYDGDGYDDFVVADYTDSYSASYQGRIQLYRGTANGPVPGLAKRGDYANAMLGYALAGGQLDSDVQGEFVVSEPGSKLLRAYMGGSIWGFGTVLTNADNAQIGHALALADPDGDGLQGVVASSISFAGGAGKLYYYANTGGSLSTTWSWTYTGSIGDGRLGVSLAAVGNVNQTGRDSLLVGESNPSGAGNLYLFGSNAGSAWNTIPYWSYNTGVSGGNLGDAVAFAGDISGDGYPDLLASENGYSGGTGRVLVFQGSGDTTLQQSELVGTGQHFGKHTAGVGDFNGDGYSDLAVTGDSGGALYLGAPDVTSPAEAARLVPAAASSDLGAELSPAGDVNGDGFGDAVVGEPGFSSGESNEGRITVLLGTAMGVSGSVWTAESNVAGAELGASVTAGDVDGDGYTDVIAGAPGYSSNAGSVYLIRGGSAGLGAVTVLAGPAGSSRYGVQVRCPGDLNGDGYADVVASAQTSGGAIKVLLGGSDGLSEAAAGYTIGGDGSGVSYGAALAAAGDVNADGYEDLAVGDPGAAEVFIYPGSASGLTTTALFTTTGTAGSRFGEALAAGDFAGDGYPDLAVGASRYSNGQSEEGQVHVFAYDGSSWTAAAGWPQECDEAACRMGETLGAADIDGDGDHDLLVGATGWSQTTSQAQMLFRGGSTGLGVTRAGLPASVTALAVGSRPTLPVASAGDMNRDGREDLVARVPEVDVGQVVAVYMVRPDALGRGLGAVHLGGAGAPLAPGNLTDSASVVDAYWANAGSPVARTRARLEHQVVRVPAAGEPGFAEGVGSFGDTGWQTVPGNLADQITLPLDNQAYRVRSRLAYAHAPYPELGYSPWRYHSPLGTTSIRTGACPEGYQSSGGEVACDVCAENYYGDTCVYCERGPTCNNAGDCTADGGCTCDASYAGTSCEYSDAVTCSGNGSVQDDGSCTCDPRWDGVSCSVPACNGHGSLSDGVCTCDTGYGGDQCQFDRDNGCNGNGVPTASGGCECDVGFGGSRCEYCANGYYNYPTCGDCNNRSWSCNDRGECPADGNLPCNCDSPFAGDTCLECADGHYNFPTCEACPLCQNGGTCPTSWGDISCECPTIDGDEFKGAESAGMIGGPEFGGNTCQYSAEVTCNQRGWPLEDGTCLCRGGDYTDVYCTACQPGLGGWFCNVDSVFCNGRGNVPFDALPYVCECDAGYYGDQCEFEASGCDGHGTFNTSTQQCDCATGFTGSASDRCDQCATGYYLPGTCRYCDAATTCNGRGTCNNDSTARVCDCTEGAGSTCQYTREGRCNGNGEPQDDGTCVCDSGSGFTGITCNECLPGHYGPDCTACDAATTCSGHGTCAEAGGCTCDTGWDGASCDTCAEGYSGANCLACTAEGTCRGRGTCNDQGTCDCTSATDSAGDTCQFTRAVTCRGRGDPPSTADGACSCDEGYAGKYCTECASGYVGYPTCRACDAATTCNGNGTCNSLGECDCDEGFAGVGCEHDAATLCGAHGTVTRNGTCICDEGYLGDDCSLSREATCNGNGTPQLSGACLCDAGFLPPNCAENASEACSGNGTLRADGTCSCAAGAAGDECETCAEGHYGPRCVPCNESTCPAGLGTCASDGSCECEPGRAGAFCQHTREANCNGNGNPNEDGTCSCDPGNAGPRCEFTRANTCDDHGEPRFDGESCICDEGRAGETVRCRYSDEEHCSSHGQVMDGLDPEVPICACDEGFAGASCDDCASSVAVYPNCFCDPAEDCSGVGSCTATEGICACPSNYAGDSCEYSWDETCHRSGTPRDDGTCECWDHADPATNCETCEEDWYRINAEGEGFEDGGACVVRCQDAVECGGVAECDDKGNCAACGEDSPAIEKSRHYNDYPYTRVQTLCEAPRPGQVVRDGAIVDCWRGTYARAGDTECTPCEEGTYAPEPGSTGCLPCTPCAPDFDDCTEESCNRVTGECQRERTPGCKQCGNGRCDWDAEQPETCRDCMRDCWDQCPVICGDRYCEGKETCSNCPLDCGRCEYRPPQPSDPTEGGDSKDPPSDLVCYGAPIYSRGSAPDFVKAGLNLDSASVFRKGISTGMDGYLSFEQSYDPNSQVCEWEGESGMSYLACVDVGARSSCTGLTQSYEVSCSRKPVCTEERFECLLEKADDASCRVTVGLSGTQAFVWGFDESLGPFYALGTLTLQGTLGIDGTQSWGSASGCYPLTENEVSGEFRVDAIGELSAGLDLGVISPSVSASAGGCARIVMTGRSNCPGSMGAIETGAGLWVQLPIIDFGVVALGGPRYDWPTGIGCED